MVKWQEFQATMPTPDQIREWWGRTPDANVALVLGRGTFAVDLDGGLDALNLLLKRDIYLSDDAPRSRTGGGYHVLFRADHDVPDRVGLVNTNGGKPQVDIRGKGIIVAPPSIHPNGSVYTWEVPIGDALPDAPVALLDMIRATHQTPPAAADATPAPHGDGWVRDALAGVGEGQRDATCTRLAGYFLGKGMDPDLVTVVLTESFARNCRPAFSAVDVRKCVASIARRERVLEPDTQVSRPEHISEVLTRLETQRAAGPAPCVTTPYDDLNYMLSGGWAPGELVYIGARPGVGKTALALESARVAGRANVATLIISREMTTVALTRRMVSQDSRVSSTRIKGAALEAGDLLRYREAIDRLSDLPIWMTDKAVSIEAVLGSVEQVPRSVGLLVVDYLQLVRAPKGITDRRLQVEEVSKHLKTLALELQIPVICLSSLSRPPKTAGEVKPTLADLRESGELEHDADVVLLLHRAFKSNEATCIVAKNREGQTGEIRLHFTPECVSFAAVAEEYE